MEDQNDILSLYLLLLSILLLFQFYVPWTYVIFQLEMNSGRFMTF